MLPSQGPRVSHHDLALVVTREVGVSQFAMFDATSTPKCSIESSPAAADIRTDSGRQIDGIGQERPYLQSRCHTVRAVVGLLSFVVLVQTVLGSAAGVPQGDEGPVIRDV